MSEAEFFSFLRDVVLVGLASFLGKVWATRISNKEQGEIKKDVIRLQSKLDSENEAVSRSFGVQSDLIKQALQNASSDNSKLFEKQFELVSKLWSIHLEIKKECGKFFVYHQILTSAEKAKPSTFVNSKMVRLSNQQVEDALKKVMASQAKAEEIRPAIPSRIFALFSGLTTFYARLGLNHQFAEKRGIVPPWFGENGKLDYSVRQLQFIAKEIDLALPALNDDLPGFDTWKGIIEERLITDIQKFLNGSLDRQLEMQRHIKSVTDPEFSEKDLALVDQS